MRGLVSGPGSAPVAVDTNHTIAGQTLPCFIDGSADSGKRIQVAISHGDVLDAAGLSIPVTLKARAPNDPSFFGGFGGFGGTRATPRHDR